ncbi:MAG: hypothetical protein AB1815_00800 [Bacillota bacterium]|jgi:hypothetical protein
MGQGQHPCSSLEEVKSQTGWDLEISVNTPFTDPPAKEELGALKEIDPKGV